MKAFVMEWLGQMAFVDKPVFKIWGWVPFVKNVQGLLQKP